MQLIKKLQQGLKILKLTNYKYFRASQLKDKEVACFINRHPVIIKGPYALSMLLEIVAGDTYHLKNRRNPKVIIDVGANIGIFSLHAATLFPGCSIYAFEPSVENFALLTANTKQFNNIYCFNTAIGNYDGRAYVCGDKDNTAFTTSATASENILHECEVITLKTFLSKHTIQSIDILKLDCEGAEYDIAEGDLSNVCEIVGEYHSIQSRTPTDLKYCFKRQGFSIKQWTGNISGIFWGVNARVNS